MGISGAARAVHCLRFSAAPASATCEDGLDPRMKTVPLALFAGALALAGCVAGLGDEAVRAGPPPEPLPEFKSTAPAPGMIWVAGAWHWNGVDHVWVPGHWTSPPPAP